MYNVLKQHLVFVYLLCDNIILIHWDEVKNVQYILDYYGEYIKTYWMYNLCIIQTKYALYNYEN